ncbi:uncharacterized protein LOC129216321 [Uloborus diversus]|uniref:uncharacterized protein LOC129216321 n=1 Tax=Uloborus diversus TaxID=327109 RepID=UPI0024093D3D|nr:uncharacterized protein LOC129216321 [Uloborus diversus]
MLQSTLQVGQQAFPADNESVVRGHYILAIQDRDFNYNQISITQNPKAPSKAFKPPECPIIEQRSQAFFPQIIERVPSNLFHTRSYQNDHRREILEIRERERLLNRYYSNAHHRYDHYSHVDRRPFLNQNYTSLPYNMVRIKSSNGDQEANDFAEDDEGNHECHNLHHEPGMSSRDLSSSDEHRNGTLQNGATGVHESNGISSLGATIYQGEWPMHRALWMSGPSSIGEKDPLDCFGGDDTESIMSFSSTTATMSSRRPHTHQLGTKVEMVYSLLSMLGSCNKEDMSRTLLEMSNNQDSCIAMRQSGCLPLLIQLLHGSEQDQALPEQKSTENVKWAVREARRRASQALHNIVHAHPDDRRGRREARVLRLLEQIRDYSDFLRDLDSSNVDFSRNENLDLHPGPAIAALMKLSFDEEHRHAMCQLGGLQAIAELIQADHEVHGNTSDQFCVTVRRYAGMALTNLTFGDGTNKALLCSMKPFMQALVAQLHSPSEDLRQVTASVLRNLSWRADTSSKQILREVGVVSTLTKAAMEANKESTLKSILSALWNLSAHCSMNKADICEIDGALEFLVSTLTYKSMSNTLSIIENGGGILRNISSHIAVREDYRAVLRRHKCLQTLLSHLKSPSLTIVSNACGTLWNLSARSAEDQQALWEMGAVGMLRNLVHSKHKMISMGSSAALKNLLAAKPEGMGISLSIPTENGHHQNGTTSNMPSLLVRKQRALAADIDENLSETCDNIDSPKTSPTPHSDFCKKFTYETNGTSYLDKRPQYLSYLPGRMYHSINGQVGSPVHVPRSESKDSLGSTRSEPPHYKAQRERFKIFINNNRTMALDSRTVQEKPAEWKEKTNLPFENNSNVVLQLFRHLQNGQTVQKQTGADVDVEQCIVPDAEENKPVVRPNSLPPPKRGVWNVRSNRYNSHHIPHNNMHFPSTENGFSYLRSNGYTCEKNGFGPKKIDTAGESISTDVSKLLEIPGNRRAYAPDKSFLCERSENEASGSPAQCNGFRTSESIVESSETREPIKSTVVLRKKKNSNTLSSSVILSRDTEGDETSVDQTPLAVSRCSSLSSLTSCFQHSARSSWLSDVSQRTSAVISPTDLPDSPSYCPSDGKPPIFEFTDKVPDADAHSLIKPKPAWPVSSAPSSDSLPSSVKRMSLDSDVFTYSNECNASVTDHSQTNETLESPESLKTPPARPQNSPMSPEEKELRSSGESSGSLGNNEENEENEFAATCINSGMQNNSGEVLHNNSILHSKVNNLCSSLSYTRSGIPVKAGINSRSSLNFSSTKSAVTAGLPSSHFNIQPAHPKSINSHTSNNSRTTNAMCDDNDNLLFGSSNVNSVKNEQQFIESKATSVAKSKKIVPSEHNFSEGARSSIQAFESKCLNVCKKYPALREKSGFRMENRQRDGALATLSLSASDSITCSREQDTISRMTASIDGKSKTAIPQIVRPGNPHFDSEQHPKQLHIKSQNLPIYKRNNSNTTTNQELDPKCTAENTSSAEENVSEDILSSSPSARDESEDNDSDDALARIAGTKSSDSVLRNNRVKSRKSKANRRSMEIRPPSEQSSEDDNKNLFNLTAPSYASCNSLSNRREEKDKEDQNTKENFYRGIIPDLLEGAAFHDDFSGCDSDRVTQNSVSKASKSKIMTESMELRKGALMIAAELEDIVDDCTHSSTSFDLDNMKPPSCMAEMSMTSSGLSDLFSNGNGCYINGKHAIDRRRNNKRSKKINGGHRFVLKSVRQTLVNNLEAPKQKAYLDKPISTSTSLENISMKSSGTSDLIENVNPPSILDDISMTNSCASLNSISSDILESRSHSLADPRSSSEMFQRLNAAAAMVQVYSREFSNIMTGSMKSSCNSECLDLVKPPSIFQDIAEVTVEDGTEVMSDPLVSDFELEEELPHDDEASVPSTETVHSPFLQSLQNIEGSSENLNSSIDGDSFIDREHFPAKRISSLALGSQNDLDFRTDVNASNSFSTFVHDDFVSGMEGNTDFNKYTKESTEDDEVPAASPSVRRGPRIVKPINRETVRQMQEKKNAEKSIKSIKGKVPAVKQRNLFQQITTARLNVTNRTAVAKTSSPVVSGVRPTRTSALRASQNKQSNIKANGGRTSPRSFLSKPPPIKTVPKINRQNNIQTNSAMNSTKVQLDSADTKRPQPLVKQGTFVKEETVTRTTETNTKVPLLSPSSDVDLSLQHSSDDQNNNDKSIAQNVSVNGQKVVERKISAPFGTANNLTTNHNLQRKLSAPIQRRIGERNSLVLSPSSHSLSQEDKSTKKIPEKKSPGNGSSIGKGSSAVGSRTASTNSLSSLSSTSLSVKKSNSQKDVPSKISSIWKRSESTSSSANSPVTDNSNADKNPFGSFRSKAPIPKSTLSRCNSATPTTSYRKNIPRSSTYEKISKPADNAIESVKPKQRSTSDGAAKIKPISNSNKATFKPKTQYPTPKATGGARIVKPVTPRPKPNAITSKTLRQSSNFTPTNYNSFTSSAHTTCISIERGNRNRQDPKVSIPLVTAPFAYLSSETKSDEKEEVCTEDNNNSSEHVNGVGRESGSEHSDVDV